MSEEKLYAVKNGKGEYWDFEDNLRFNRFELASRPLTSSNDLACRAAFKYHGHVVTFIQEPKKVVLSKKQAEIVEKALIVKDEHGYMRPAKYIADNAEDCYASERSLMDAYVNGYTVAKEKKYNVKVPHAVNSYFKKIDANYCIAGNASIVDLDEYLAQFTESEIEHYGLQDCEKEEVTDDDD